MSTYVLVPGACHGGWWYDDLVAELRARGHEAEAVTLAGLEVTAGAGGSDAGGDSSAVNLTTHIDQVGRVVERAAADAAEGVVLVGHSYAGTVITAVADRMPGAVRALVYLDAFVPEDGDSCYSMTNDEQRAWYIEGSGRTGLAVDPLPFFDERARPHPLASLVQQVSLSGSWAAVPTKVYAAAEWPGESPFASSIARVQADPVWDFYRWATRHNVMHDGPARVLELLLPL
ncbi:alpha/beta fold hydrolase [Subtercola endophyticus]|uniref:alpha/beta fold hydrolase n=1 Tax=Subtercola endophyticus TaxID=2895559 RepID=UPI001E3774E2|nr:alpha/beta fold hydrolase [Subtercola endophyticus]UFS58638.1 alpha/beta fold hydrolase [Subtercola endophyticus]